VKCVQYEHQLQQAMEELKSVQLIIQMLRNEYMQEHHKAASVQQAGPVLLVNDSWVQVPKRSRKKHTEGKIELSNLFKSQTSTTNQYAALESESITSNKEVKLERPR